MNCFGQKLDAFLYDYPSLGAFNFHPSNLACSIGIGAQPFQEIMHRGLDTSPIVIHKVTEIIDAGPVVGISPEINIRLPDGSFPLSIISLLMKMNSICGWMTIDLLLEILDWKSSKEKGTLTAIDFNKKIPDAIKLQLLEPEDPEYPKRGNKICVPDGGFLFFCGIIPFILFYCIQCHFSETFFTKDDSCFIYRFRGCCLSGMVDLLIH